MMLNEFGRPTWYNEKGENLHRTLLKAPLSFLRVTSRYSMARKHPVYGKVRPHQGVDYGAPHGTPVMAVGDGVVKVSGRVGGFGNQVIIRHSGDLESLYGHLSRFARGIRSGAYVHQGQTIGYVGSTGVATGPHLDFRLRRGGNYVNPTKLIVPRGQSVSRKEMRNFKSLVAQANACWNGAEVSQYHLEGWLKKNSCKR